MPALLLVIAFVMPPETSVSLGSLRLSPYRVILLIMVVPSLLSSALRQGRAPQRHRHRRRRHALWCIIAFGAYGGLGQALESGGIYFVESFGAYAMGRRYVRNVRDFQALSMARRRRRVRPSRRGAARVGHTSISCVRPSAPCWAVRHCPSSNRGWALPAPSAPSSTPSCSASSAPWPSPPPGSSRGPCCRRYGAGADRRIVMASFVSLSAGAWLMLGLQIALAAWDRITRGLPGRWAILGVAFIGVLVVVSMLSNRSPVKVFISYASFSAQSSYNRILIWEYGTAEVARHPLLGIGLGDWVRAPWMSASMDNFWLVVAVRYGLPALIFLVLAILIIAAAQRPRSNVTQEWANCRLAWISTMAAIALAACTVHLWNNTFGFFMFMLGAGAWLADRPRPQRRR
jgi:hypothetical protein